MKRVWDRIDTWLRANAPPIHGSLNPGASAQQIADLETALGLTLPDDFRAFYRIHNGAESSSFIAGEELLSLERIRGEWGIWKGLVEEGQFADLRSDTDGRTVADWWSPGWVPLTSNGGGDHCCIDLSPGPLGKSGQIIGMIHDDGPRPVVASSFAEWMEGFADDLEAGRYVYSEEYGGLAHPEDV